MNFFRILISNVIKRDNYCKISFLKKYASKLLKLIFFYYHLILKKLRNFLSKILHKDNFSYIDIPSVNNNFFKTGEIVIGDSFIGRNEYLDKFQKYFNNHSTQNISIVGMRRIGKTSLIYKATKYIPDTAFSVYVDVANMSCYYDIWQNIFSQINKQIDNSNVQIKRHLRKVRKQLTQFNTKDLEWVDFDQFVTTVFKSFRECNLLIYIILDEFDRAEELFKETYHFERFRTLFSSAEYCVNGIIISRRSLPTIEKKFNLSSTFAGIFNVTYCKGFNNDDMNIYYEFFTNNGFSISNDQKERILYYANNIPYLLSIIGNCIMEEFDNKSKINVDEIFKNKCPTINQHYRQLKNLLEKEGDLQRILPFIVGPRIGVTNNDKDELECLGYLNENDTGFLCISEFFTDYLKSQTEILNDNWKNICEVDKLLKGLLEREISQLSQKYKCNDDNFDYIFEHIINVSARINSSYKGNSRLSILKSNQNKNRVQFNVNSTLLDVMSLRDTILIILENWNDIFKKYFDYGSIDVWEEKFMLCALARDPIAHNHSEYLTSTQISTVDAYCNLIRDTLNRTRLRYPSQNNQTIISQYHLPNQSSSSNVINPNSVSNITPRNINSDPYSLIDKEIIVTRFKLEVAKNTKLILHCLSYNGVKIVIPPYCLNDYTQISLDQMIKNNTKAKVLVLKYHNNQYEAKLIEWIPK